MEKNQQKSNKIRIVFMGTPAFAIPSLDLLQQAEDVEVMGVVTATDKLGGRGRKKVIQSAVKRYAIQHNLPVLQPKNLKSPEFHQELSRLQPELLVVVAFRMLPEVVWRLPTLGTINLHASLLPAYRGAAPINWAIIRGEKTTGLTTFFIDEKIDTGMILQQVEVSIDEADNAGSLHDRMMDAGGQLVLTTVRSIRDHNYQLTPQDDSKVSKAPKIFHDDAQIDFGQSSHDVYNFIRGMSPYPGAWTIFDGKTMKILGASSTNQKSDYEPGTWLSDGSSQVWITTNERDIELQEVQMEGRKRMSVKDFLNGFDITAVEQVKVI